MHGTEDAASATSLAWLWAVAFLGYLAAALRERRLGRRWSHWRTASWAVGMGLLALAMHPAVAAGAHRDFRGHMLQHLLLGMLAPLPIVLSAPITLILRAMPTSAARKAAHALSRQPLHALSHPIVALILDTGGLWLLYLTPLYAATLHSAALQTALHVHFTAAGCLFAWALIGVDPSPRRPRFALRVMVLGAAIAAHSTLAKVMYAYGWPRGTPHSVEDIQQAAQVMYYTGDGVELLVLVILFTRWYRERRRSGSRRDYHVQSGSAFRRDLAAARARSGRRGAWRLRGHPPWPSFPATRVMQVDRDRVRAADEPWARVRRRAHDRHAELHSDVPGRGSCTGAVGRRGRTDRCSHQWCRRF